MKPIDTAKARIEGAILIEGPQTRGQLIDEYTGPHLTILEDVLPPPNTRTEIDEALGELVEKGRLRLHEGHYHRATVNGPVDKIGNHWSPIILDGLAYARQQKSASKALWATLAVLRDTDIAMYEYSKKKGKTSSVDERAIYGIRERIGYVMGQWLTKAKIPKGEINKFLDELTGEKERPKRKRRKK